MEYKLITLPYEATALEPVISAETLALHHDKHLQTYVNNLNAALPGSGMEGLTLEEIVCKADDGIFNNAGQILNHNLYFLQLSSPKEDNAPKAGSLLADRIASRFGSFSAFQEEFAKKGAALFGSGWVWLSADKDGELVITQESNAGNPLTKGLKPLLTFDVWEHAYYVDYRNRRPDYLKAMWQIVNWDEIERRYSAA